MKTEPGVFSFDDLVKAPQKTTFWEGVRNYQARNLMRDEMKMGDESFIYHSGIDEPEIAGIAVISKTATPDDAAFNSKSKYFDSEAKKKGTNPWVGVTITATQKFSSPITRTQLKETPSLKNIMVLKKGARLSVQPITNEEAAILKKLQKLFSV